MIFSLILTRVKGEDVVWDVLAHRVAEDSLQVFDVLDRHPQRLDLGESLAGSSGQGKTLPQLSKNFVAISLDSV